MQNKSVMLAIKQCGEKLTSAERKVTEYILNNSEKTVTISASELAAAVSVAPSAVIRCCKSLGFSGYSELKIALSAELSKNKALNYVPYIYPHDGSGEILDKIFSANIKTLHDTAEHIDRVTLQKAVDLLSDAKTVYIYGVGTSGAIVNDFQYRLMQIGITALCFTDIVSMKLSAVNMKKGDVAVGISHSGRTEATVDALKHAKENGAVTVAITGFPDSVITRVSDYSIGIYSDEIRYPIEAISARIAHISVIDAIATAISAKNYQEAERRSRLTRELTDTVRYK